MTEITTDQDDFSQVCSHNLAGVALASIEVADLNDTKLQQLISTYTQKLLKKLYTLDYEPCDDGRLICLPKFQTIVLPRSQHLPTPKKKSRWQRFAELQNIKKKKHSRLVWDPITKDWAPRWGKGSVKKNKQKVDEAIIELKDNEDFRNVIESRRAEMRIKKAKQNLQEHRNKVEAAGGNFHVFKTKFNPQPLQNNTKRHIKEILNDVNKRAALSTASYGVYTPASHTKKKSEKHSGDKKKIRKSKQRRI